MKVLIEQGVALELLNDDSIRSMMEQVQNFPNESIIDDSMAEILDQLWKKHQLVYSNSVTTNDVDERFRTGDDFKEGKIEPLNFQLLFYNKNI